MALVACVRSSDTEISALIIRARNHGFHHWTGWAAWACQVGLHVSLGSAHTPLALLSRQPQLRPGETQRELQWPHGAGPADCRHSELWRGVSTDHQQPRDHAWDIWNSFTTPGIDWLFCQWTQASAREPQWLESSKAQWMPAGDLRKPREFSASNSQSQRGAWWMARRRADTLTNDRAVFKYRDQRHKKIWWTQKRSYLKEWTKTAIGSGWSINFWFQLFKTKINSSYIQYIGLPIGMAVLHWI